jgi:APA family basic amino acid/polyamine antiporter
VLILFDYLSGTAQVFRVLVLMTSFTAAVPYLLSAAAQLHWLARGDREKVRGWRWT